MAADAEGLNLANMIDNAGQINLGVKTQPGAEQQSLQDNNGIVTRISIQNNVSLVFNIRLFVQV